jgi:hypothetical protein
MEESHKVEEKRKTCPPRGAARRGRRSYPVELRLKLVKKGSVRFSKGVSSLFVIIAPQGCARFVAVFYRSLTDY